MKQTTLAKMQDDSDQLIADTFIDLDMMSGARSPEELLKIIRNNSWTFKRKKATADLVGNSIAIEFKTGQRFEIPIEEDSGWFYIGRKVFTESKKLQDYPLNESRLSKRKRVNEAISRKQKERLNLLNDIVNFAYEYGENETKTLFQQAFKKAIGDDLIESLSDDE